MLAYVWLREMWKHATLPFVARQAEYAPTLGTPPSLEHPGLLPPLTDNPFYKLRRPADVYRPASSYSFRATFDFAGVSAKRQDAALRVGAAATAYEAYKRSHLNTDTECAQQDVTLIAMEALSSGVGGCEGFKTLRQFATPTLRCGSCSEV